MSSLPAAVFILHKPDKHNSAVNWSHDGTVNCLAMCGVEGSFIKPSLLVHIKGGFCHYCWGPPIPKYVRRFYGRKLIYPQLAVNFRVRILSLDHLRQLPFGYVKAAVFCTWIFCIIWEMLTDSRPTYLVGKIQRYNSVRQTKLYTGISDFSGCKGII